MEEAVSEEHVQRAIEVWRSMHIDCPLRGLDELMGIIKYVYRNEINYQEDIEFFKSFRKFWKGEDRMAFQKTGEAPIVEVRCACGGEYKEGVCQKCGKKAPVEKPQENK